MGSLTAFVGSPTASVGRHLFSVADKSLEDNEDFNSWLTQEAGCARTSGRALRPERNRRLEITTLTRMSTWQLRLIVI